MIKLYCLVGCGRQSKLKAETTTIRAQRLYSQIKAIAVAAMQHERTGHTLQPTAVAHEAFIRLSGHESEWDDDAQFMRAVVRTIRRVLVDHARTRGRLKRGGDRRRVELREIEAEDSTLDLLLLDELLTELVSRDRDAAFAMEASVFGGLRDDRIADLMNTDVDEVRKHRRRGRAWLAAQLRPDK